MPSAFQVIPERVDNHGQRYYRYQGLMCPGETKVGAATGTRACNTIAIQACCAAANYTHSAMAGTRGRAKADFIQQLCRAEALRKRSSLRVIPNGYRNQAR